MENAICEIKIPNELTKGNICIGTAKHNGIETKAYLPSDTDQQFLPLTIIGPSRAGKSTLIANMAKDAINNGECVVIPDYTRDCELSETIISALPKDKVLILEFNNIESLQGLGYNEFKTNTNSIENYMSAKMQTDYIITLVNSVKVGGKGITLRMRQLLEAASMLVTIQDGPIKDIFSILRNYELREKYISELDDKYREQAMEYISILHELDWKDNNPVIGTRIDLVPGILDRINQFMFNEYIKEMLEKGTENNINLTDELQRAQLIAIKMPERMFASNNEKDIFVTYWLTKIWSALQMRDNNLYDKTRMRKVNMIIDDMCQLDNAEEFLKDKLYYSSQLRAKVIIACHHINQLKTMSQKKLKALHTSYILMAGCNKQNYRELQEELHPYTEEDILNIKRYHSLNIIECNYSAGTNKFITVLPKPLS